MITREQAKANIAANLSRMLADRNISQTELAKRTGDDQAHISQLVRGRSIPGADFLARVAEALDTSTDKLLSPPPATASRKSA